MGSCYSVDMTIKCKDATNAVTLLKKYISDNPLNANFMLGKWAEQGVGTDTLDDLVTIMLAGWEGQKVAKKDTGHGFTNYSNGFSCSYGWEAVMLEMFFAMAPALADESELNIDCDDGIDEVIVENGEATQIR